MANETGMTLNVSQELVRPVIEAKIQAAIVAELSRQDEGALIADLVSRLLRQKVDDSGNPSDRSYHTQNYTEWLCQKAIQEAAKVAVNRWIEKNRTKIEKHIELQLTKNSSGMAKVFVDGLLGSIESRWQFNVAVNLNGREQ